jgi:tetratricopeptide (TPR) repeat protein
MFGTIKQAMLRLSQQMEGDKLTSFGLARAHQSMGDLLKRLGQGEAALREYQHALDLIEQVVQKDADNDLARGNQALMVAMMAEKKLELTGNAQAAYENFQRSCQIQQDIADHPRSGFYRDHPPDNERLRANYHLQQGRASLLLADLEAARRSFESAVRLRRQVAAAAKNTNKEVEAQGYLAEACYWLGQACSRHGDARATQAAFDEAAAICEELARRFPNYLDFKNDLADVYGAYGDAHICLGRPSEARRLYEKALPLVRLAFDKQADKLEYRRLLARTHYRLGLVERDAAAAQSHFQEALRPREQILKLDGQNVFYQADLASSLAHCGQPNDAARLADSLRKRIEHNPTLLLQLAGCYAQCASTATVADRSAYIEKALQAVRLAVTENFKDRQLLKTDPDLEPIRRHPGFQEILSRLGGA